MKYFCPVCGKKFKVIGHPFTAHLRTHVKEGVLRQSSPGRFTWADPVVRARPLVKEKLKLLDGDKNLIGDIELISYRTSITNKETNKMCELAAREVFAELKSVHHAAVLQTPNAETCSACGFNKAHFLHGAPVCFLCTELGHWTSECRFYKSPVPPY